MGKVAAVLLTVLVIAELILVVGIAGALFWFGAAGTMVAGGAMLAVALVSGVVALRAMRPRR